MAFALIALAAILAGEFNRRGQVRRILWATAAVIIVQLGYLGATNLTVKVPALAPLLYLVPLAAGILAAYLLFTPATRRGSLTRANILSRV